MLENEKKKIGKLSDDDCFKPSKIYIYEGEAGTKIFHRYFLKYELLPYARVLNLCIFLGCNFLRISQIVRELIHFIQQGMQCLLILQSDKILEK